MEKKKMENMENMKKEERGISQGQCRLLTKSKPRLTNYYPSLSMSYQLIPNEVHKWSPILALV